jgi:murein L,D-transpeptidase YafK
MRTAGFLSIVLSCPMILLPGLVAADAAVADFGDSGRLPAYVLELPDSVTDILLADAASATMYRFAHSGDSIVEKDRRYMSIGLKGTGKQRAWDRKTPLGIYFITESLDTSKLHDKYGAAAYPLDYPNARDRQLRRTGNGIWLHGVDRHNPDRPPLDTDGCLALRNEEILLLANALQPLVTPVIVAREVAWSTRGQLEHTRLEFRLALDIWKDSLAAGDVQTYLSLYADDFRYRDMDKSAWSSYRLGVFAARTLDGVNIDDVMLFADPEEPNLYLSRFTQVLLTDDGPVTTVKRLYWRHRDGNRWEIVTEDSG